MERIELKAKCIFCSEYTHVIEDKPIVVIRYFRYVEYYYKEIMFKKGKKRRKEIVIP